MMLSSIIDAYVSYIDVDLLILRIDFLLWIESFKWTNIKRCKNKLRRTRAQKLRMPIFPFFHIVSLFYSFTHNMNVSLCCCHIFSSISSTQFIAINVWEYKWEKKWKKKKNGTHWIFHHQNVKYTPISMLNLIFRIAYDWF